MKKILPFAAAFMFAFYAGSLWANVDYPCLNSCAATGKASLECLHQCTSDQPSSQTASQTHVDYRCIDLCVHGGKPASSCMSRCTYSITSAPATPNEILSAHDVLQAPVPAGDTIVPPRDAALKPEASKNYDCIRQCLHDGMQYELCNTNCAGVTPEYETTGQ